MSRLLENSVAQLGEFVVVARGVTAKQDAGVRNTGALACSFGLVLSLFPNQRRDHGRGAKKNMPGRK
jgi:hypothetical protein